MFRVNYSRPAIIPGSGQNVWNASRIQNVLLTTSTPQNNDTLLYNSTTKQWNYAPGITQLQTLTGNNETIDLVDGGFTILRPLAENSTYLLNDPTTSQTRTLILESDFGCNIVTSHGTLNLNVNNTSAELLFDVDIGRWIRYDVNTNTYAWFVSQQQQRITGVGGTSVSMSSPVTALYESTSAIVTGMPSYLTTGAVSVLLYVSNQWQAPILSAGQTMIGTGAVGNANQGQSVSMAPDASYVVSGGPLDNGGIGATWVFIPVAPNPVQGALGITWSQQGTKLVGTGNVGNCNQGYSVAISADATTIAVGGYLDDGGIGATWIFTRSGSTWSQQGSKLVGTGYTGPFSPWQGRSVSLSEDGNVLAVGGPLDANGVGATWIFTRSGGVWSQLVKLVGTDAVASDQGWSVSLSQNGRVLAVGGPGDNSDVGATWIFTTNNSTGTWTQEAKIVGTGYLASNPYQGASVSLTSDGRSLAIGGPLDQSNTGSVWIFTRDFSWTTLTYVWTQQYNSGEPKLRGNAGSSTAPANFGTAVSFSTGGLAVSAPATGNNQTYTFI